MLTMRCMATVAVVASLIATVQAHARVLSLSVNGAPQGDGKSKYIRFPLPPNNPISPVKDVSSDAIYCGLNNTEVPSTVNVKGGDTVTFHWTDDSTNVKDDNGVLDPSHKGPITVYIALLSTGGVGPVWTKIFEDGYSGPPSKTWASDTLIKNGGKQDLKLPQQLSPGKYILRTEIISLHEADNPAKGAQFYPSCSQINVIAGGNKSPPDNFDFKGGYTPNDPGILINIYSNSLTSYPIPGPDVWTGADGQTNSESTEPSIPAQTKSTKPTKTKSTKPSTSAQAQPIKTTSEATSYVTTPQPSATDRDCEYRYKKHKGPARYSRG